MPVRLSAASGARSRSDRAKRRDEADGHQLPGNIDNFLIRSVCGEAVKEMRERAVLPPHVSYCHKKYSESYPGGINIGMEKVFGCLLNLTRAIAAKGFEHILLTGPDPFLLSMVARVTAQTTNAFCDVLDWPALLEDVMSELWNAPTAAAGNKALSPGEKVYDAKGEKLYEMCVSKAVELIRGFGRLKRNHRADLC